MPRSSSVCCPPLRRGLNRVLDVSEVRRGRTLLGAGDGGAALLADDADEHDATVLCHADDAPLFGHDGLPVRGGEADLISDFELAHVEPPLLLSSYGTFANTKGFLQAASASFLLQLLSSMIGVDARSRTGLRP